MYPASLNPTFGTPHTTRRYLWNYFPEEKCTYPGKVEVYVNICQDSSSSAHTKRTFHHQRVRLRIGPTLEMMKGVRW